MVETVHNTYGALVIGVSFAIFLFGIVTVQTYQYYVAFPNDRVAFRYLVTIVWFLELGHTMGITYEVYTLAVSGNDLSPAFVGLGIALLIGGLLTMLVQCFFARRLWKLLPRPYNFIGLVCIFLAAVRAGGSTYLSTEAIKAQSIHEFRIQWNWLITALLSIGAGLDVIIAGSMLSFLMVQRDEGLDRLGRLIDRLVAYTIRTGVFTSVTAVLVLICFQLMPGNFVWIAIYAFLAKLYSNSLLAALMERRQLRNAVGESSAISPPRSRRYTTNRSFPERLRSLSIRRSRPQGLSIEMHSGLRYDDHSPTVRGYWQELPCSPDSPRSPSKVYYGANGKYV